MNNQQPPQGRWPEVTAILAAKKHGKSSFAEAIVRKHHYKNALILKEGINLYDEAFYGKYRQLDDFYSYKGGKVIVNGSNIEYKEFLHLVKKYYRNGILMIDDTANYEINDPSKELRQLLIDSRKLGIEVFLMYQGFDDFPIRIMQYLNNLIQGYTIGPERVIAKFPGGGHEFLQAHQTICSRYDQCKYLSGNNVFHKLA